MEKERRVRLFQDPLQQKILSWIVLIIIIIAMLYTLPGIVGHFFKVTFEDPYKEQQLAIQKSNKTEDTASGIKGVSVNSIPLNDFEKIFESLTSKAPNQFKNVNIQIPEIYVKSPMFNTDKLKDIWIDSINEEQLKEQYGSFKIFYNGSVINDNGTQYSSESVSAEQLQSMKDTIQTELSTNDKFKDIKFKKWFKSDAGIEDVQAMGANNLYNFEGTIEIKDLKPDILFDSSKKTVTAKFTTEPEIKLIENSLEIK